MTGGMFKHESGEWLHEPTILRCLAVLPYEMVSEYLEAPGSTVGIATAKRVYRCDVSIVEAIKALLPKRDKAKELRDAWAASPAYAFGDQSTEGFARWLLKEIAEGKVTL